MNYTVTNKRRNYMTVGTAIFSIGMILIGIMFIALIIEQLKKFCNMGEECFISVESLSTGIEYHASRYRFNRHNDIEIMIYNGQNGYQWYPIWHFKNAFLLAYSLDKNYAMNNMYKLMTFGKDEIKLNKQLTETKKK